VLFDARKQRVYGACYGVGKMGIETLVFPHAGTLREVLASEIPTGAVFFGEGSYHHRLVIEGAGFEVYNIGVNNPVENFLEAIEEHKPDIVGMSALLTTTMPYMKVVIDTMIERGIRDDHIVLVGGAPLNDEFGKAIGADAYCRDAAVAVETAKQLIAERRGESIPA